MCRNLSAKVVLSYVLQNRDAVSTAELAEKRQALIRSFGDVLADVSFSSIRKVVSDMPQELRLCIEEEECTISRSSARMLSEQYLDLWLSGYFSADEKRRIKEILTT